MNKQQIKLMDFRRIWLGDVPVEFYLELIIRALFVYLLLMVAMRLIGKRMSSRLGRTELVALVTLAATIGIPLTAPERGLLPPVIIAILVVIISRWIAAKAFKDQAFETFALGGISTLVNNGVMDLDTMKKVRLTRERLVSQLRQSGIKQLGEVKRLYMEANGGFTLIPNEKPSPGLFIIPRWDNELYRRFIRDDNRLTCENCGFTRQKPIEQNKQQCKMCGHNTWTPAVTKS
ncbi:DUF421 domain-containing protein [Mucilaginibacter phyllosphaerae]|uniref:DUF421 domain-containing protein n=1 Tax=Mucilaginibacter phyllosphaerae TaxID=1812349 RepID=A0A4Y8AB73_9SPHI|nr:YetF domain-containing protein [Mucilaginibacter phyllosphaerae]MBB3969481.1 uncharacterized membrane protein YcaP (DUF421 family) [Mucilaginibacter phyllosphaerae]TEW65740.1 DUF421 domain-containing protein [Mucilaginibacter phyllosphaerae]GGH08880.1 DUF421 domain-containing protein [Mucilaginibacter phyllosphaerae]